MCHLLAAHSNWYDPIQAETAPDIIETVFGPTYVPQGFELVVEDVSIAGASYMWCNEDDIWIDFTQSVIPDNPELGDGGGINSESSTTQWITLGESSVLRIEDDEWVNYVWTTSEYEFNLNCSSKSLEDEMQKMYYSIKVNSDAAVG